MNTLDSMDLIRHFSKEYAQMAKKPLERCSTSLALRERQIKTTFYPLGKAVIKKRQIIQSMVRRWRNWNTPSLLRGRQLVPPLKNIVCQLLKI